MFGIPVGYSTPFTITDMSTKVYIDEIHLFILNNRHTISNISNLVIQLTSQ